MPYNDWIPLKWEGEYVTGDYGILYTRIKNGVPEVAEERDYDCLVTPSPLGQQKYNYLIAKPVLEALS